jgi:hypothetical protein
MIQLPLRICLFNIARRLSDQETTDIENVFKYFAKTEGETADDHSLQKCGFKLNPSTSESNMKASTKETRISERYFSGGWFDTK